MEDLNFDLISVLYNNFYKKNPNNTYQVLEEFLDYVNEFANFVLESFTGDF